MKKVDITPSVELSMRSLDPEGVRKIHAWFDCLAHWDEDEAVRENSFVVPGHEDVYMLRTSTDIRIFFRIDGPTITVLDLANRSAILASGGFSLGGSADVALMPGTKDGK